MDILKFLSIGLVVGLVSGIVGIGGGVLLVPALIWVCGLSYREAAGTTLAVLVVPVLLPAAWGYYKQGNVDIRVAAFVAVAMCVGAFAGAWLRNNDFFNEETLKLCFGLIMMYVAFNLIVTSDSEAAKVAAGLIATVGAWLAYIGLRIVGKRNTPRPKLQEQIQRVDEQGRVDPEYHI